MNMKIFIGTLRRQKFGFMVAVICAVVSFVIYNICSAAFGGVHDYDGSAPIFAGMICGEDTALTREFTSYFTERLGFELFTDEPESFNNSLINKDISAVIEIPKGAEEGLLNGEDVKIRTLTLDDYENAAFITAYINTFMFSASAAAKAADGNAEAFEKILSDADYSRVNVEQAQIIDLPAKSGDLSAYSTALGFMEVFTCGAAIFISLGVLDDKLYGTYTRMKCSSVTSLQYLTGTGLAAFIQSLICIMPLTVWLALTDSSVACAPAEFIIGNILFALFVSGLGIFVAMATSYRYTLVYLFTIIASIGSIAGGAFFPISDGAGVIKVISVCTPFYWVNELIKGDTNTPLVNICILALFGVLTYLISAVLFTKKRG